MGDLVLREGRDDVDSDVLVERISELIEHARQTIAVQANATLTLTYWNIGQLIDAEILKQQRADYGKEILATVSQELTVRYGRGYDSTNLSRMVRFSQQFSRQTLATLSQELSWSHIKELLPLKSDEARDFYARQVAAEQISVRELRGVIARKAFERREIANSLIEPGSAVPMDVFKDPYLLDFLGMKDEYSEADLEAAIIREMERFLLEFGKGFTFVERQKRMVVDGEDFYLDLLLYNRILRRLVAVELKIGRFKASFEGQMKLYLKWLARYEQQPEEKAPIGLLLVAQASREQIELLEMHKDGIIVAEYLTDLLPKADLETKLRQVVRDAQERLARRGISATASDFHDDDHDE